MKLLLKFNHVGMVVEDREQAQADMDILTKFYPEYKHYFIYDNAPSHLKRSEGSVTAHQMPKFTFKIGNNWGIEAMKCNTMENLVYNTDGSLAKERIQMGNTILSDGTVQLLYLKVWL